MTLKLIAAITAMVLPATIAAAADAGATPDTTINCSAFKKMPDGSWYVGAPTTVSLGGFRKTTFSTISIGPHNFTMGGADVYEFLESKCGAAVRGAATHKPAAVHKKH
jgi:hypothetical protein